MYSFQRKLLEKLTIPYWDISKKVKENFYSLKTAILDAI